MLILGDEFTKHTTGAGHRSTWSHWRLRSGLRQLHRGGHAAAGAPRLFASERGGAARPYGSGRESPARALRAAGVRAIIGASFGRMFYRNAINNGILVVECTALARAGVADGDLVEIDPGAAAVRWDGRAFRIAEVPDLLQRIVLAGNLIVYGKTLLNASR
jgi:hypothetical protein